MRGSSPRVRGTLPIILLVLGVGRIIPARAGNTANSACICEMNADHPRACGEHFPSRTSRRRRVGSSPRVRGTLDHVAVDQPAVRIIPARAGNTTVAQERAAVVADHPRACGEHLSGYPSILYEKGSSPRVRGTLCQRCRALFCSRIIPARAGNTLTPEYHEI